MATRFRLMALSAALYLLTASSPASADDAPRLLSFGVHPYLEASRLVERFTPLLASVDAACSSRSSLTISKSYAEHVERAAAFEYDYYYIGSFAYVLLSERAPSRLLARIVNTGESGLRGALVTAEGSDSRQVADFKGKRLALADPYSTTGYVLPLHTLLKNGLAPEDFEKFTSLSTHDDVALGILLGEYDVGGIKEEVYAKYEKKGLSLVTWTEEVADYCFVASPSLDPAMADCIRDTLLSLNETPRGTEIIRAIKPLATRLREAKDSDYDSLRRIVLTLRKAKVLP